MVRAVILVAVWLPLSSVAKLSAQSEDRMIKEVGDPSLQRFYLALRAAHQISAPQDAQPIENLTRAFAGDDFFPHWQDLPVEDKEAFQLYHDRLAAMSPYTRSVTLLGMVANVSNLILAKFRGQSANGIAQTIWQSNSTLRAAPRKPPPEETVTAAPDAIGAAGSQEEPKTENKKENKKPWGRPRSVRARRGVLMPAKTLTAVESATGSARIENERNKNLRRVFLQLRGAYQTVIPEFDSRPESIQIMVNTMKTSQWALLERRAYGQAQAVLTVIQAIPDEQRAIFLLTMITDLTWEDMNFYFKDYEPEDLELQFNGARRYMAQRISMFPQGLCRTFSSGL